MTKSKSILLIYADGKAHHNGDLYMCVDFGQEDQSEAAKEIRHKRARGIQSYLSRQGWIENICPGYWILA